MVKYTWKLLLFLLSCKVLIIDITSWKLSKILESYDSLFFFHKKLGEIFTKNLRKSHNFLGVVKNT